MGFCIGPMPQMRERTLEMAREIMEQELWLPIYEAGGADAVIRAKKDAPERPPNPAHRPNIRLRPDGSRSVDVKDVIEYELARIERSRVPPPPPAGQIGSGGFNY